MVITTVRLALASTLILLWCALAVRSWTQTARRKPPVQQQPNTLPVIYASQSGTAEGLAKQLVQAMGQEQAYALPMSSLNPRLLANSSRALFVVSTTGEGDPPDAAVNFQTQWMQNTTFDLSGVRFGLLALGDRRYRKFCHFGLAVDAWLQACGAQPLFPAVTVDQNSELALRLWHTQLDKHVALHALAPIKPNTAWRLRSRRVSNPGSLGEPCYHLILEPLNASDARWQPGDIATVHIAAHEVQRDYSIASIPEERALHLLVRMRRADDGTSGRGSQWLGQTLSIGSIVLLHIRSNPGFHLLDTPCPALFIGNGTGIAGLRALLKQRHARGHMKNWLVYGERQAAVDQHFGDELKMWLEQGKLERLDLAFSRDSEPRYVADVLRQDASHVERWISQGACIYVCGTRNGMANDVDHALQDILSPHQYEQLKATGRYRRDVY